MLFLLKKPSHSFLAHAPIFLAILVFWALEVRGVHNQIKDPRFSRNRIKFVQFSGQSIVKKLQGIYKNYIHQQDFQCHQIEKKNKKKEMQEFIVSVVKSIYTS